MSALVDEFADVEDGHGFLIESAQWAPSIIAGGIGRSSGREHKETMARLGNAAWLIGLQRDRGHGTVGIDAAGNAVVRYALDDEVDVRVAHASIAAQIRIHAAAGADEIVPFAAVGARWRRGEDLEAFIAAMQRVPLRAGGFRLFSAHQMSSCRMGEDPTTSVADPWGELHDTPGVHVGDASALPTASRRQPDDLDHGARPPHRGGDRRGDAVRAPRPPEENHDHHRLQSTISSTSAASGSPRSPSRRSTSSTRTPRR